MICMIQIDKTLPFKRTINSPLHDAHESWWLIVIEIYFYLLFSIDSNIQYNVSHCSLLSIIFGSLMCWPTKTTYQHWGIKRVARALNIHLDFSMSGRKLTKSVKLISPFSEKIAQVEKQKDKPSNAETHAQK